MESVRFRPGPLGTSRRKRRGPIRRQDSVDAAGTLHGTLRGLARRPSATVMRWLLTSYARAVHM